MKKKEITTNILPSARIEKRIFWLRGEKVMLDADLAELYEVPTRVLIQAVKRNSDRFPEDFMFQLTEEEAEVLRSHIVTASKRNIRYRPYAFTEPGVAMLSTHEAFRKKIESMEKKYDKQFKAVFDVLKQLLKEDERPKEKIGFREKK
jgi:hypothetical protein